MTTGLICGTSLLDSDLFSGWPERTVRTERGPVTVREGNGVNVLQRHASPDGYRAPHEIDHRAHMLAFRKLDADLLMAVQSAGSLTDRIPPGTFAVPHDFLNPWQTHTRFPDRRGHRVVSFDDELRSEMLEVLDAMQIDLTGEAVYVQTRGPRFETPAEGRMLAGFGDIVGMTAAAELILATEHDLPYATICSIDNYVNGIEGTTVDYESFKDQVAEHQSAVIDVVRDVVDRVID